MMLANNVSSRRKQSKPQRLPSDSINGDESIDPSSSLVDGHVCGDCSGSFYDVSLFVEHKKHCRKSSKQNSLSPEAPIDLSNPRSLDDKSNILFQSFDVLHHQQQKLLELYAQLASRSSATVDESNGDDSSPRSSCLLSPPCSNEEAIRHVCAADRCNESFVSRGALLWHVLNQHPTEKLLQCDNCEERFTDHDQVREHRCEIEQRASSAGEFDRGTSPDADRGSVPALSRRFDFRLLTKSPAITSEEVSSTSPSTQTSMFVSMLKETPLDLTLTANHFMQMPPPIPPSVPRQSFEPLELPYAPLTSTLLGSDDDWEALMEVSQTDELEKIRALVGDKALPTTDPNQCLLCRRVLSCKSALQMHYRTHTGERPFKCKICQRAFTTKGNLKTHMGVHRSKHSFRHGVQQHGVQGVQHQCPICQKRFFSPQLLQQHIQQHTHQLTRNGNGFPSVSAPPPLPPPSSCSTESATPPATMAQSHNNLSLLMSPSMVVSSANGPSFPSQAFAAFPALLGFPQLPPHLQPGSYPSTPNLPPFHHNSFGTKPFPGFSTPVSVPSPFTSPMIKLEMTKPEQKMKTDDVVLSNGTAHHHHHHHHHQHRQSNGQLSDHVDDLELATVIRRTSSSSSREPANPLDAMKKMWAETEPPPPRAPPVLSKHQCAVCFKHFSSSSALQIHMRTHTGDKPFKCDICSRAFTTRGNLKVHMGTHMWQQNPSRRGRRIFEFSSSGDQSNGELLSPNGMEKMLPLPPSSMVPPPPPPSAFAFSPLPLGGAAMAAAAAAAVHGNPEMMRWMWHTVCSVCQKICSCPAELEQHLQQHLQQTTVVSS